MRNAYYYVITVLIWGSTWLAIKFQLGVVPPELSVAYRFSLAAVILFSYSAARGLRLRFNRAEHAFMALQGFLLFSFNYALVYLAEGYLTSGLVAIIFSMIIITNVIFGAVFLRNPVRPRVVVGALVGIGGLLLIFAPELTASDLSGGGGLGIGLAFASVISASLGNIVSARNQRNDLPVIQTNAFGMAYGAVIMFSFAVFNGADFAFETTFGYTASLLYLALFGSVIAFGSYLTLLGKIGADRAAYVTVLFPVIALILSTLFESMTWSAAQFSGVALVLLGNTIVLAKKRRVREPQRQAVA
ncbi:MAG: EamA family transporter [Chloroflexi bacterium]|nr:EamA family transporter [Chloroflexota bacterium]